MAQVHVWYKMLALRRSRIQGRTFISICRLHLQILKQSLFRTSSFNALCPVKSCTPSGQTSVKSTSVRMFCEQREVTKATVEEIQVVSGEQLQQIARQIRDTASVIDKMALSIPLRTVTQSVKTLIENGVSVTECLDLASKPAIIKHFSNFTNIYSVFTQYGYTPETAMQIFKKLPELITLKEEQLIAQYESLRALGFTDGPLETIVTHSPDILLTHVTNVQASFSVLKSYFTTTDVIRIFEKCPEVLKDTVEGIDAKILYAKRKMDATNRQMLNSNFFQHLLAHIETRHMFVVRAGFWRIAKKREIHFENPLLRDILDTSDEEFVKLFGNMTVKDYSTFKTLFEREKDQDVDSLNPVFKTDDGEYSD